MLSTDPDKHGILCAHPAGHSCAASGVWGAACLRAAAYQGQVLEFCILQVYLRLWCDECPSHG